MMTSSLKYLGGQMQRLIRLGLPRTKVKEDNMDPKKGHFLGTISLNIRMLQLEEVLINIWILLLSG